MKKGQTRSFRYPYFASELWHIYLRYKKANKRVRKRMVEMYGYTSEKRFVNYLVKNGVYWP